MTRTGLITLLLAFAAAAPAAGVALWSIGNTIRELSDPCARWDHAADQPVYVHVAANDVCRSRAVHTESRLRASLRAAIVPGGLLVSAMLAIAGCALSRRRLLMAGGIGMLAESLVVFTIAPLTVVAGAAFLLLMGRVPATSV